MVDRDLHGTGRIDGYWHSNFFIKIRNLDIIKNTMSGLQEIERARQLDRHFRTMDLSQVPIGKPIDERSLMAAASDPNAIEMDKMLRLHEQNERNSNQMIRNSWANQARNLGMPTVQTQPVQPVPEPRVGHEVAPVFPTLPTKTNAVFQTYQDIVHDLKNFQDLPHKTNLQKLNACFLTNGRAYVSITTFIAFCILMIILVVICLGVRNKP